MSTENNEMVQLPNSNGSIFTESASFEQAQRVAKMLSSSSLIPKEYQNNIQNTMIALEMANRIGASPLMVMQNLYIIHGKPSWSSTFIISAINSCGRFTALQFDTIGEGDKLECYAWAIDKKTSNKLVSPKVSIKMAKDEGWLDKAGSKWKTMPELMIRYRAAAFFGRLFAPDILMGMHTEEEIIDITAEISTSQIASIERLLPTSALSEQQRAQLIWDANHGMTSEEASKHIVFLKQNQLNAITQSANPSAKDINSEVNNKIS